MSNQAKNHDIEEETEILEKKPSTQDLEKEIEQLKDRILRNSAELDNMRKRTEKQIQEERQYALTSFARDLISVIDNLDLAISHKPSKEATSQEVDLILQGVEMICGQLKDVLAKHGISQISTSPGQVFDHNIHQAISQVETDQYPNGSVVTIMQKGYKIKDRLLRPASVTIAKEPEKQKVDV